MRTADYGRLLPIPKCIYDELGGIQKSPLELLLLSWMRGGMVFSETKTVNTKQGEVTIKPGEVWGSRVSMIEDILASVGSKFTYAQVRYATDKLIAAGFVEDMGMVLPKTRGAYGKKYKLSSDFSNSQVDVDVRKAYDMFYNGDPSEFNMAEIVTAVNLSRGVVVKRREGRADPFIRFVAREGFNREALTSIGRWRRGEVADKAAPVYIPWLTIDIDRTDPVDAFADTRTLVTELLHRGYDMERVLVSFSGNRGYHIQISMDQFGSPVFTNSDSARVAISEIVNGIVDDHNIEVDSSVFSPLSLLRTAGSKHATSGLRKVMWTSPEFMALSLEDVYKGSMEYESTEFPDPLSGAINEDIYDSYIEAMDRAQSKLYRMMKEKPKRKSKGVIDRIKQGIDEGEVWHEFHVGRNKAAFILACYLLERYNTHSAREQLDRWNTKNTPPLPRRELDSTFRSASWRVRGEY